MTVTSKGDAGTAAAPMPPMPTSGDKVVTAPTGRPPTTSVLRSAMYYQNRIIIKDAPDGKTRSPSSTLASTSADSVRSPVSRSANERNKLSHEISRESADEKFNTGNRSGSGAIESSHSVTHGDASRISGLVVGGMDGARGIDIIVTDTDNGNSRHELKKNTLWRRLIRAMQDNRMAGKADAELKFVGNNPDDYRILKRVLNIVFLTIGIALLVAVVSVIIYTTIGKSHCNPLS